MREIYSWFGYPLTRDQGGGKETQSSSFELMSAQLSIDLVYTILHSICKNTVGILKSKNWLEYQDYDFTNKNTVVMDHMIVSNLAQMQIVEEPVTVTKSNTFNFAR